MRLILALLISLSFTVSAQVYKWTDSEGNTHFGDRPPPGQQKEICVRDNRISGTSPTVTMAPKRAAPEVKQAPADKLRSLERVAEKRACDLTKTELAAAHRKLTLALSVDQASPMVDYRRKQVDLWERRQRIECLTVE